MVIFKNALKWEDIYEIGRSINYINTIYMSSLSVLGVCEKYIFLYIKFSRYHLKMPIL